MTTTHFLNKPIVLKGLAIVLWIVASALALVALNGAADVILTVYAAFFAEGGLYGAAYGGGVALRQVIILFGSLLVVAFIIGGAEYSLRHTPTPRLWRIFAHVLGAEAAILLLMVML